MLERPRGVVPLRVVADHGGRVLHAVIPLCRAPDGGIAVVAEDHVHRHAIAPCVVQRHGRVLQAHRAVRHDSQRPAFDLVVRMRHRHRRLFVAAGDQLGLGVPTVVDDRLVQAAKARPGVGADVVEVQRLEDVDHVIGPAALVVRQHLHLGGRRRFRRRGHHRCRAGAGSGSGFRRWRRRLSAGQLRRAHERGSAGQCTLLEKSTALEQCLLRTPRSSHGAFLLARSRQLAAGSWPDPTLALPARPVPAARCHCPMPAAGCRLRIIDRWKGQGPPSSLLGPVSA